MASDWKSFSGGNQISNWAILPAIPGQSATDQIGVHVRQQVPTNNTRIEVRYSPTGGTSTGSSGTDVGDFTDLLIQAWPPPAPTWQYLTADLPGDGRIALRYYVEGNFGNCAYIAGIDQVAVGSNGSPCNGYPLVPTPGQTVIWRTSSSPHRICSSLEIPAGGRVIVEQGSTVLVEPGNELTVRGQFLMRPGTSMDMPFGANVIVHGEAQLVGTAALPITLTGDPGGHGTFGPDRLSAMPGGSIQIEQAILETTVNAFGTGVVNAEEVVASGINGNNNGFFASGESGLRGGNLALRNCLFLPGSSVDSAHAYLKIEDCSFDKTTLRIHRGDGAQDMLLDGLTAVNHASDSVFQLSGGNFMLGESNVIQNNQYPVTLNGGGLLDGSVLPTNGNMNDMVHVAIPAAEGNVRWGALSIPYRVDQNSTATVARRIDVSPGAHILMAPNAALRAWNSSVLNLEGTPDQPIRFESEIIGSEWLGVLYAGFEAESRVEYTEFRDMLWGLQVQQGRLDIENNLFSENTTGLRVGQSGYLRARGNRLTANTEGVHSGIPTLAATADLAGDGNPNWFDGNGVALTTKHSSASDPATGNYWGAASGPQHTSNPSGTGDICQGNNIVIPFVSAEPDPNRPPLVRLERHARVFDEGDKVWLKWNATDDDTITHFRILHAPHGVGSGLTPIASNIPASARAWEIVVPPAPPASNYTDYSVLRVEGYDSQGLVGWDQIEVITPYLGGFSGGFAPDTLAGPVTVGQEFEVCGQFFGAADSNLGYEAWITFEGDDQLFPLGFGASTNCSGFLRGMPAFSTDTARIMTLHTAGAGGMWSYQFSDSFEVRPNAAIGDLHPQVALTTSFPASIPSGTTLPLDWTASDDEGLRSFTLQATYNGGRTWHTLVESLDGGDRSYDWHLPPSSGLAQVGVRVIARDHRFQNSSSASPYFAVDQPLGTSFCEPVANSGGEIGRTTAMGSVSITDAYFGLGAWDLPPGVICMFVDGTASSAAVMPAGSVGNLCVSGSLGRFNAPGQIGLSDSDGSRGLSVDLMNLPAPSSGTVMAQAGQTWYFTAWYRDLVGSTSTSNFTDAIEVTFLP